MAEYIEREAAIAAVKGRFSMPVDNLIAEVIGDIPAADVVEVVRCRDCENRDTEWEPSYPKEGYYFCSILGCVIDSEFYCGCGIRKDGGQDDGRI